MATGMGTVTAIGISTSSERTEISACDGRRRNLRPAPYAALCNLRISDIVIAAFWRGDDCDLLSAKNAHPNLMQEIRFETKTIGCVFLWMRNVSQ